MLPGLRQLLLLLLKLRRRVLLLVIPPAMGLRVPDGRGEVDWKGVAMRLSEAGDSDFRLLLLLLLPLLVVLTL